MSQLSARKDVCAFTFPVEPTSSVVYVAWIRHVSCVTSSVHVNGRCVVSDDAASADSYTGSNARRNRRARSREQADVTSDLRVFTQMTRRQNFDATSEMG